MEKAVLRQFRFTTNVRLDRKGVIMALSMVTENHWFCVHINLETGYGLYADSIANSSSKTHLAMFFKEYAKYTKTTLLNSCKLLMKFNQQEASTNVEIFM